MTKTVKPTSRRTRRGPRWLAAAALAAAPAGLAAAPAGEGGAYLRVTCRGVHELVFDRTVASCAEADELPAADGRLVSALSEAHADLTGGRLGARAAGGAVRDIGYNGAQASALLKDRLWLHGEWRGRMPVRFALVLRYRLAGPGEARVTAHVAAGPGSVPVPVNEARVRLRGSDLAGSRIEAAGEGRFDAPPAGSAPREGAVRLGVTEARVAAGERIDLRAGIRAVALPNLGPLDERTFAVASGEGELSLAAPCPVRLETASGASPVTIEPAGAPEAGPAGVRTWRCAAAGAGPGVGAPAPAKP